jgi:uncharacterized protein YneF (UPF0154 family)
MNNVQLVMACVAFVSLLATILGGAWINQRGLEKQMEAFRSEVKAELSALGHKMDARFDAIDQRFDNLESRVDRIERQFDTLFKLPKAG